MNKLAAFPIIVAASFVSLPQSAQAQVYGFERGMALWSNCSQSRGSIAFSQCENYIAGAFDGLGYNVNKCPDLNGVHVQQVIDVAVGFMAANPQLRNRMGVWLVKTAVDRAWNCR